MFYEVIQSESIHRLKYQNRLRFQSQQNLDNSHQYHHTRVVITTPLMYCSQMRNASDMKMKRTYSHLPETPHDPPYTFQNQSSPWVDIPATHLPRRLRIWTSDVPLPHPNTLCEGPPSFGGVQNGGRRTRRVHVFVQ